MGLALTIDETNYYQTEINGILQPSKEMQEFGINVEKKWEPIKLSKFIKMHRAFFTDKSQNMMLVSTLKNFKAKVNMFHFLWFLLVRMKPLRNTKTR